MLDQTHLAALACSLLLAGACAGDDGATATATETAEGTATEAETETTAEDTSATTSAVGDDDHGFVCVDLNADPELPSFWIEQTATVQVRLHYTQCLQEFYLGSHPEYRVSDAVGEAIFASWADALCTPDADSQDPVACSIAGLESFVQLLATDDPDPAHSLQISYEVEDSSTIAGGRLRFGPLPLEALAGCSPAVTILELADIQGLDEIGTPLWQIESFANTPSESRVSEGGCVEISIGI